MAEGAKNIMKPPKNYVDSISHLYSVHSTVCWKKVFNIKHHQAPWATKETKQPTGKKYAPAG